MVRRRRKDHLSLIPSDVSNGVRPGRRRSQGLLIFRCVSVVLVTGGSGTLGSRVVSLLREDGHEVRVLSRKPSRGTHVGDLTSGRGLKEATEGADLVVHAASDTHRFGRADVEQTKNLLREVKGARHVVFVSIVGIDAIPYAYYRRKLACEQLFESGDVPYTIARATQFHELLAMALKFVDRLLTVPLPLDFQFQPAAASEVAARVVGLLAGGPIGRADDFGGPQVSTLAEIVGSWRELRGRPRSIIRLPLWGPVASGFREALNTCPAGAKGTQTWREFVQRMSGG